ncbi:MAG: hypothetical protein JWP97_2578 [Labilithrix sp.]|nr:hypothetical protein [Labilithrix sp.]
MNQSRLGLGFVALALMAVACGSSDSSSEGTDPRTDVDGTKVPPSTDAGVNATDGATDGGSPEAAPPPALTYTVGGTTSGLTGAGLVLQNNAGDDLAVKADGAFAFAKKLTTGSAFDVTIKAQPANQTCSVSGESGSVGSANLTSVMVNCTANKFTVGGTATGLLGSAILQNNGVDELTVSALGKFAFATGLETGAPYAVTIKTQPAVPSQVCTLASPSGIVAAANVTDVALACVTNKFKIKVAVTGVAGAGLVLKNNAGDPLTVAADGTYEFATPIDSGQLYAVTVATQPTSPAQTCAVTKGSGTVGAADAADVTVACTTNTYKIGGTVTGLTAGTVVLQDNLGDNLSVTTNGAFSFATKVASGKPYAVTVLTQPAGQSCAVATGAGTVAAADITSVAVTCSPFKSFTGIQQNLPVASLAGWTQCYLDTYAKNDGQLSQEIVAACTKANVMLACRATGATTLTLAAYAPRADVFFDTGSSNVMHVANGVGWYFNDNYSMGFAPPGDTISRNQGDTAPGPLHLSWHTLAAYSGGFRCGDTMWLNSDATWERVVYHAD